MFWRHVLVVLIWSYIYLRQEKDTLRAQELPPETDNVDELLKSINYDKEKPKTRGKKREISDADTMFLGPKSYRKSKKGRKVKRIWWYEILLIG